MLDQDLEEKGTNRIYSGFPGTSEPGFAPHGWDLFLRRKFSQGYVSSQGAILERQRKWLGDGQSATSAYCLYAFSGLQSLEKADLPTNHVGV